MIVVTLHPFCPFLQMAITATPLLMAKTRIPLALHQKSKQENCKDRLVTLWRHCVITKMISLVLLLFLKALLEQVHCPQLFSTI